MHNTRTSVPTIKSANCGNCGRFLSFKRFTCAFCGDTIAWDQLTIPNPDTTLPPQGTSERAELEWRILNQVRTTTCRHNAIDTLTPGDLAHIITQTLEAANTQGLIP